MSKHNSQSDPYQGSRHSWGSPRWLGGHPYDQTAHLTQNSYHVYSQIGGQWYRGEMTFYRGHTEVHLDGSAVHIGSLTNQHFVVQEGTRWLNVHVLHSNDGETHVHTTPIGHSPVPDPYNLLFAPTLPPLPEIHLFDDDYSEDDDSEGDDHEDDDNDDGVYASNDDYDSD
jgi:hypothetical protein